MSNLNIITNPTFGWLPIILLFGILGIGGLIGFINGWRVSFYFLGWNATALTTSTFVYSTESSAIKSRVAGFVSHISIGDHSNLGDLVKDNWDSFSGIVAVGFLLGVLLLTNLIALIIYLAFRRKKLKEVMVENQNVGVSNASIRFMGFGVGVITAVPIAALAATSSSFLAEDNSKFAELNAKLTAGVTLGQFANTDQDVEDIRGAIKLMSLLEDESFKDAITEIGMLIQGDPSSTMTAAQLAAKFNDKETHENVEAALNNPLVANSLPSLLLSGENSPSTIAEAGDPLNMKKITDKLAGVNPFVVDESSQDNLVRALQKSVFKDDELSDIKGFVVNLGIVITPEAAKLQANAAGAAASTASTGSAGSQANAQPKPQVNP